MHWTIMLVPTVPRIVNTFVRFRPSFLLNVQETSGLHGQGQRTK